MKRKNDMISVFLDILVVIISIIVIYMLIKLLFGKSPTAIDIIGSLVGLLTVNALRVQYNLGNLDGKFGIFNQSVKEGFKRVREDMEALKESIKENTEEIKGEIRSLKGK